MILRLKTSTSPFGPPMVITLPLNNHPTLGLLFKEEAGARLVYLTGCQEGTKASRIPRWKSTIKHSVLRCENGQRVETIPHVVENIERYRRADDKQIDFVFASMEVKHGSEVDVPQLYYDQLRHINQLQIEVTTRDNAHVIELTRSQLKRREDFDKWREADWVQHDKYLTQKMFGDPILRPPDSTVLPFVWNYSIKEDPITARPKYKARATCNGGKRFGKAVTLAETYATCVEQPACRLFWLLVASQDLIAIGADAGNAFAEALPPVQPYYMQIDAQFYEWWTEHRKLDLIPPGYVLPVLHALQGHPEAPRLWETHIHTILTTHICFKPTTHEKCIFYMTNERQEVTFLLRQVDDFAVASKTEPACRHIIERIGSHLQVPLNQLGIIRKFNGVNILLTKHFVKISCEDYLDKVLRKHGWQELQAANRSVPMRSDSAYQRSLELATRPANPKEQQHVMAQAQFSYRMAMGELIYAMIVARPDISYSVTKLSQYSSNPAFLHYQAVKQVFAYLHKTRADGLVYWRSQPYQELPAVPLPELKSSPTDVLPTPIDKHTSLIAYSDSDWGSDASHRRSITGIVILISGAAVINKTKYQTAIALSTTEAEFVSAFDAGKLTLYHRTILQDHGFPTEGPTTLCVDNTGAAFMMEAQAPTRRTRHVDIRFFALLQWCATDQIRSEVVPTDANISDSMTKQTGRIKHYQHLDIYMGNIPPRYATAASSSSCSHVLNTFVAYNTWTDSAQVKIFVSQMRPYMIQQFRHEWIQLSTGGGLKVIP